MEGVIFNGLFWGGILIVWGVCVIINSMFNIHIPVFRLIIAFVLVYFGVRILAGGFKVKVSTEQNTVLFNEARISGQGTENNKDYNVIFGKGVIDLSDLPATNQTVAANVNAIFGEAVIEINPDAPVRITANSAFGAASLPDESVTSFGKYTYKSLTYGKGNGALEIEASVVFGSIRFVNKRK